MLRFPKIFVDKFETDGNFLIKDFTKEVVFKLFDGKNSIEDIYAFFLSENFSFEKINNLLKILIENGFIEDKINFESAVLSNEELEILYDQIITLSLFSQKYEETKFSNLLFGLNSQEKICQSKLMLFGNSALKNDVFDKCTKAGIKAISTCENFQEIENKADLLIYLPKNYDENELLSVLKFCKKKNIAFFPIIQTNYGVEFGPFYILNDSSCSLCLINRKKSVLGESYDSNINDKLSFNFPIGADLILVEILKFLTGIAPLAIRNKILQYNIISSSFTYHTVLKVPNCEICGYDNIKPKRKLWEGIV